MHFIVRNDLLLFLFLFLIILLFFVDTIYGPCYGEMLRWIPGLSG